jgi:hypothetical protein
MRIVVIGSRAARRWWRMSAAPFRSCIGTKRAPAYWARVYVTPITISWPLQSKNASWTRLGPTPSSVGLLYQKGWCDGFALLIPIGTARMKLDDITVIIPTRD